ncbi:MAG TPA: glycosyltransferase family 9 protein [Gemmatimonadaceae bacterium]|nr:glycosyltransferase family 9 protein [Gemmatimonadaceae bacterium]
MAHVTGGRSSRRSPLHHGYLVKHPALNLALRTRDAWLERTRVHQPPTAVPAPRRLLVCVGGHLGDAVLATSVFPVLQAGYPGVEIGVLAPSWSLPVFENHPAIRWRHAFDHWKTNRSGSARERWLGYRRTAARAVVEINEIGYDIAIDLYPYFPNAARILSNAAVPIRVGYKSGGGGPLYTHAVGWVDTPRHTVEQHLALMRGFLPDLPSVALHYDLPTIGPDAKGRGRTLLENLGVERRRYVALHPGSGNTRKQWPAHEWRGLVDRLRQHEPGMRIVLTGHGSSDSTAIDEIRVGDASLISACDRTSWDELRYLLGNAALVVGVDSLAVHLAAAGDVPCIAIMAATSDPAHWRPLGSRVRVQTKALPCAPCFRSAGCVSMACVRGVTADAVAHTALELLDSTRPSVEAADGDPRSISLR